MSVSIPAIPTNYVQTVPNASHASAIPPPPRSGIILSQALQKNFGFNTSDIGPDYLTKQVVSDVVQFLKDNEADLDYGLAYVPGVVGYGLLTLSEFACFFGFG